MTGTIRRHWLQGGIAVMLSAMLLAAFTGLTAAAPRGDDDGSHGSRPGWGCGDRNHVHTGPRGGGGGFNPCTQHHEEASEQPKHHEEASENEEAEENEQGSQQGMHLSVSAPASAVSGTAFTFTVTALNGSSTITSFADTVHFTSSDGAASLPADSTLTNGTGTFSATLRTVGSQTISATDTANSSMTGTSGPIAVSVAAVVSHFAVTAPASATAGSSFNFTVTAQDQFNNTITSFADTVHFTSSDGGAVLPANSTLTNGTGTFSATLHTAGNQTITATDTANSSMTGTSGTIVVASAAATHMAVSAPAGVTAGSAFSFTVTAQDQFNNTATGYAGTVHFTSSDGAASLPANSTLTNGSGTFPAMLHTIGNQTITATDTVTASITGTSGSITVS